MSEHETHTPGFVWMRGWDASRGAASIVFGLPAEFTGTDFPDKWLFAGWFDFANQADAREFVKRWNAHEQLLAACKARLAADDHFRTCDKCGADLNGNVWYCGVRNQLADHAALLMHEAVAKASQP